MTTRITEDFLKSLGRLTPSEQKRSHNTIFSIFRNDRNAGLRAHKIEHPSNKIFSYSVNMDLRVIVHATSDYTTILYIGHHDDAYDWIAKRKFVDSADSITIIQTLSQNEEIQETGKIRAQLNKDKEIDAELKQKIRDLPSDDEVISFILDQPEDIQDQLLAIVENRASRGGYKVTPKYKVSILTDDKELEDALQYPLDLWRIFLHPRQREVVDKGIETSVFITGCPGTGKTVCLVHKIRLFSKQVSSGECIILGTFKKGLQSYLEQMLSKLDADMDKVFIEDISALKIIEPNTDVNAKLDGFYQVIDGCLYFYNKGEILKVRHLFFDEYQDYKLNQSSAIQEMSKCCPFTIAFDYSQSIYRRAKYTIDRFNPETEMVVLGYTYRISAQILERLKKIMAIIKALSVENGAVKFEPIFDIEEEVISKATAAISGEEIGLYPYSSDKDLNDAVEADYKYLISEYGENEIVVTSFFSDLFNSMRNDADYHSECVPKSVRASYLFAPTLKGKEYKVGMIILDDSVCQMLNINQLLLGGKVKTDFLGGQANYRLNLNLLYVVISRFRDYIKVYYPQKYELIINPLFE